MKRATILLLIIVIFSLGIYRFVYRKNNVTVEKKYVIVATTSMIADAAKEIVRDNAVVHTLMGPGVDPHLYRARESDVHKLAVADIVFYNGLHLEGKMGHILKGMHYFTKTVAVTDAIDTTLLRTVDFDDMYDPHVWFDVFLWIIVVQSIQHNLMLLDEEHAYIYKNNGDEYIQKLQTLHKYIQNQIDAIAHERRILITAHDAFGYFGRAYGFKVIGLQGLSTDADISTKDIQQLSDYIVNKKISAIFLETSIPERSIVAVQNAVAAKGWKVEIGNELYSDALGGEHTQAASYIDMITYNVNTIIDSLGE